MAFKNNERGNGRGTNRGGRSKGAHFATPGNAAHGFTPSAQPDDSVFEPLDSDTPRPIGVDPAETGSFERIPSGTGVIMTNRDNADQAADAARKSLSGTTGMMRLDMNDLPTVEEHKVEKHTSKPIVAILAVLAIVVIGLGYWLFKGVIDSQRKGSQDADSAQEQVQGDQVTFHDDTYQLGQREGGTYYLMQTGAADSTTTGSSAVSGTVPLGDLKGTPVTLALYNGVIVIPENLSDGTWDIAAYTLGSGWSQLMDSTGAPRTGKGTISAAALDGNSLKITTDQGDQEIPLEW